MSVRAVEGSLGVICAIGLALAGIGWRAEQRSQPRAPERVFCDIDALARYHPAWDQLAQVRLLLSQPQQTRRDEVAQAPVSSAILTGREPTVGSEPRAVLQARLEQRAREELTKIGSQLDASLLRRLDERRREREAQAQASEAAPKRASERELEKELRALSEAHQFERVDAAIKLVAIEAQLSVEGTKADRIKQAIEAKDKELGDVQTKLDRDEDDLRKRIATGLAEAAEQYRSAIEGELAGLKDQESQRIDELIRSKRERLEHDLDGNGLSKLGGYSSKLSDVRASGIGAATRAARSRAVANSQCASAAAGSDDDLAKFERALRARVRAELEAVVRRIARENSLVVTFERDAKARDRTDWFRKRLPYAAGRKSG